MSAEKSYTFTIKQKNNSGRALKTINTTGTRTQQYIKPKNMVTQRTFFHDKIKMNDALKGADPGVYTWILKGTTLYATKVISQQEIGTLHYILNDLTEEFDKNTAPIIAAGELMIRPDGHIGFNLLSGTYYKKFAFKKTPRGRLEQKTDEEMDALISVVFLKMKEHGMEDVEYIADMPLIKNANIRTSSENMNYLNEHFNKLGGKRKTRLVRKTRKTRKSRK